MSERDLYYSVSIPYSTKPTEWHPTEPEGRFSTLERGVFWTREDAHAWAREHLEGQPYTVVKHGFDVEQPD